MSGARDQALSQAHHAFEAAHSAAASAASAASSAAQQAQGFLHGSEHLHAFQTHLAVPHLPIPPMAELAAVIIVLEVINAVIIALQTAKSNVSR